MSRTAGGAAGLRIVGIADTDSYVKWGAALLGSVADAAHVTMLVLETPLAVSAQQQRAALARSAMPPANVKRVEYAALLAELSASAPDAVLLAARGPLVRVLARLVANMSPRPVIVTGLPGISSPATSRALWFRTECDLFVLHSVREVREFGELARFRGLDQRFALSRLPFVQPAARPRAGGTDLVFAAQAIVPRERHERIEVARMLIAASEADPARKVVVKLRAGSGEKQTHRERHDYRLLLARLTRRTGPPPNLEVSTEPMARALDRAEGLVTVSSTAAVEAIARRIPVIALDTFGISERLINTVFVGSGLLGSRDEVVARAYRVPDAAWLEDNYFHDTSRDDWFAQVGELVSMRRRLRLPPKPPLERAGGRARHAFERKLVLGSHDRSLAGTAAIAVGLPLRAVVRATAPLRRLAGPAR